MQRRQIMAMTAALAVAAGGVGAPAAHASESALVDFGACAFADGGVATVPSGEPITLTDTGSFAEGTYGLALHAARSSVVQATIAVPGGATTTIPLAFSSPQYLGAPYDAWLSFLPNLSLAPLPSGGSVLVTIDQTSALPGEIVFPRQKYPAPHFGPFHVSAGDTFETQCLVTANG